MAWKQRRKRVKTEFSTLCDIFPRSPLQERRFHELARALDAMDRLETRVLLGFCFGPDEEEKEEQEKAEDDDEVMVVFGVWVLSDESTWWILLRADYSHVSIFSSSLVRQWIQLFRQSSVALVGISHISVKANLGS